MIGVPGREGNRDIQVIIGVDTHQDEHVAVAKGEPRSAARMENS